MKIYFAMDLIIYYENIFQNIIILFINLVKLRLV